MTDNTVSSGRFASKSPAARHYTYTGREWDKETGLYYYRARYYDPMEGRFISKDPIGFKGGINLYGYVDNNPINRTDPEGLFWLFDCVKCFYYMNQCAQEGLKCKKKKCQEGDLPPTSDELFNDCYKGIPSCQKQFEFCGKCALSAQGSPTRGGK